MFGINIRKNYNNTEHLLRVMEDLKNWSMF